MMTSIISVNQLRQRKIYNYNFYNLIKNTQGQKKNTHIHTVKIRRKNTKSKRAPAQIYILKSTKNNARFLYPQKTTTYNF